MQYRAISLKLISKAAIFVFIFFCFKSGFSADYSQAQTQAKLDKCIVKTTPPKKYYSTAAVLKDLEKTVRQKLSKIFANSDVKYPPENMTWICLKAERELNLYARDNKGKYRKVLHYPIIGASGKAGPKLSEGDMQVPEGFYRLSGFRPNLVAHMGLDVNYPNEEDREHARKEHRKNLGYDILIHGSRWSTGCLAMGNEPIEEMFVLAHDVGLKNISLIFAPCDLTEAQPDIDMQKQPKWLPSLYARIKNALMPFK
jgi:murein L,D-transpeptidase YafK